MVRRGLVLSLEVKIQDLPLFPCETRLHDR